MLSATQLAIAAGIIAAIVTAPQVYGFTNKWSQNILSITLADGGRPRNLGLLVHGAVVAAAVYLVLLKSAPAPVYIPPLSL